MTPQQAIHQAHEIRYDIRNRLDNIEAIKGHTFREFTECALGLMQMHDITCQFFEKEFEDIGDRVVRTSCVEVLSRLAALTGMTDSDVSEAMDLAKGMNFSTHEKADRIFSQMKG